MTAFLQQLAGALDSVGARYMVVGSFASTYYGLPRSTRDVDVVVDMDQPALEQLLSTVTGLSFYVSAERARDAWRRRRMFNVIDPMSGWKADLIFPADDAFERAKLQRRQQARLGGVLTWVATAEDTVLSKLVWAKAGGSERQLADVSGVLQVQGAALDRDYIEGWVDALRVRELWDQVIGR